MKVLSFLSFVLLVACSSKAPRPVSSAEAQTRAECRRDLFSSDIHSIADFVALGEKKETEGMRATDHTQRRILLACAMAAYEAATALDPKDARPYLASGQFYFNIRDLASSKKAFQKALELDPKIPWANLRLAQIERNAENVSEAIRLLEREMLASPKGEEAYIERGNIEMAARKFETARAFFSQALERNPQSTDALLGRSVALNILENNEAALRDLQEIVKIKKGKASLDTYYQLGLLHRKMGNKAKAIEAFRTIRERAGSGDERIKSQAEAILKDLSP